MYGPMLALIIIYTVFGLLCFYVLFKKLYEKCLQFRFHRELNIIEEEIDNLEEEIIGERPEEQPGEIYNEEEGKLVSVIIDIEHKENENKIGEK